jgi:transposase
MMPGVTVANVARKHGATRWQIYDWRKQIRKGNLVLPESGAALPMFAELVVDDPATDASPSGGGSDLEIIVGDVVIRAGAGADEGQLTRAIRAARAAAS